MLTVSRNIHIAAPVERVFALMSDPVARSRLNPDVTPIRVEIEEDECLRVGSVCHFRLQAGGRIIDYRTQVRELVPNRRIVSVSDSEVPFEITLETVPEGGGTRLAQTERFEPTDAMLFESAPADAADRAMRFLEWLLPFLDLDYARRVLARREELLREKLEDSLDRWLAAIKQHLETAAG